MKKNQHFRHIITKAIIRVDNVYRDGNVLWATYTKLTQNKTIINKYKKPLYIIEVLYTPMEDGIYY